MDDRWVLKRSSTLTESCVHEGLTAEGREESSLWWWLWSPNSLEPQPHHSANAIQPAVLMVLGLPPLHSLAHTPHPWPLAIPMTESFATSHLMAPYSHTPHSEFWPPHHVSHNSADLPLFLRDLIYSWHSWLHSSSYSSLSTLHRFVW
jgi:hypothetical protein